MRFMIIDGNSIINRAFYGIRMLNAPDGTPTNAVYGFLSIYRRLMGELSPDAVAVTFDLPEPTFRHKQYALYKAQRRPMPEELRSQIPLLKEVLDAMHVRRCELAGWEADDLLGTASRICEEKGIECVVVTGDKDSLQLIGPHTAVYHIKSRMGRQEVKVYDRDAFFEEYGFEPRGIVDLKALMGDPSDNIPGVPGVGEKTAMDLMAKYGSLEKVYGSLDEIKESIRKKLEAGRDSALMSYDLATIRRDAPMGLDPEDARLCPPDNDKLWRLFRRLDFKKFSDELGLHEPAGDGETSAQAAPEAEKLPLPGPEELKRTLGEGLWAVLYDGISDTWAVSDGKRGFLVTGEDRQTLELLALPEVRKAGYNVKDCQRRLLDLGIEARPWEFDCALAAYLLDPTAQGYELEDLCSRHCGFELLSGENEQLSLLGGDEGALVSRAAALIPLRSELLKKLEAQGLTRVMNEIELPLCPVLARMEKAGFLVDRKAITDFGTALSVEIDRLTGEIYSLCGTEFNINSPKQLGEVLFGKLGLPAPKKTKTGYSTNAEVLEKLRPANPAVGKILEYRELSKLKSTYTDGLLKVIGPDGRIHTSFQMTVTATGRLSSTEPNLQNIPIRRELGGEIRKMFVAPPGMVLVDADYSQIELRILAAISRDEAMTRAFKTGVDIHRATAAGVLGISPEEVTHEERSRAKAVNFGIVYGISAFSLSEDIHVSVAQARDYINAYMARYRGVADYMERTVREARESGAAVTLYGRRRPLPELASSNFNLRSFGERVARNMPIQGTAADIMKLAMIRVDSALRQADLGAQLLLQVHDELIVQCPEGAREQVAEILKKEMEGAAQLAVPLTAEVGWGPTWYAAK